MTLAYTAVLVTIVLTVVSQLLQKSVAQKRPLAPHTTFTWYFHQPAFWLALICLGIGMLFWLYALTMFDVSKAYSLLSANYLLVPLLAQLWFNERLTGLQWIGIGTLIVGLILVSHS